VQAHVLTRATGQNQARALALSRADRAEDVHRGGPLVLGRRGTAAAPGPAPGDLVLLPDAGLIGEPDLYRLAAGLMCDRGQAGREVFLKALYGIRGAERPIMSPGRRQGR
jgi:hypothetical protein